MELKKINKVKNKEEAREIAMAFQNWSSQESLSYSELAEYGNYFEALGKKFKLTEEFKEEGII